VSEAPPPSRSGIAFDEVALRKRGAERLGPR
jgi:hypothetical protein